jgi:hypothetical protein
MHWVPLFSFMLPSFFHLLINLSRRYAGLMMCSIHIDETTTCVNRHVSVYLSLKSWTVCLTVWITNTLHMVLEMTHLSGCVRIETTPVTIVVQRFSGYKYLLRLALITILHSFFLSHLGFMFLLYACKQWRIREAPSTLGLLLRREVLHRATHLRHRGHLLDHHHRWDPRRRSPHAAPAQQCLSRGSLWEGSNCGSFFIFG